MHEVDSTKNTAIVSITKSDVVSISRQVPPYQRRWKRG